MQWRNSQDTYGAITKLLHWLMALAFIGMLIVGFIMEDMPSGPDKLRLYSLHKATGIVLLGLVALRLGWRLANKVPELPLWMPRKQHLAAHAGHWGLYALMFAIPLTGWLMSSSFGFSVSVYGLFTMPDLVEVNKSLGGFMREMHGWLAIALIALLCAHVGAALLHHFYFRDKILKRMLPW